MTHVLVTGAAGYLGSVICEHLLAAGHKVTAIDNLTHNISTLFQFCANPNFDFYRDDVRNEGMWKKHLPKADAIIHLAAIVGAPACDADPVAARAINLDSVHTLLKLRSPNQLIIYPNTNSGYGSKGGGAECTEDTPLEPISLYGVTKTEAEKAVLNSPNSVTFRLATVFGMSPRMRLDLLVNHFTYVAVTDGYLVLFEKDFKRNYIHIRDAADAMLHAIANAKKMSGRAYNLGLDNANLTKLELAETIKKFVPDFYVTYASLRTDPDKRDYIVSNKRLRDAGFSAKYNLEIGIQELIKGYRMLPRSSYKNV